MATVNLLPTTSGLNTWTLSTGIDVAALVQDDHTAPVAADSNYLSATASGKQCYLLLDDFTEAHSSIDGVQLVIRAGNDARGVTYDLRGQLLPASGSYYYTEDTGTENSNRFYLTHTFTNRTTYNGSNAWSNLLVNGLRAYVRLNAISGGTVKLTQVYVIVTYTEPLTNDAIFFGTNF